MPTYRLKIAYDGSNYAGWQVQSHARTIQGTMMDIFTRLEGGREVHVAGAGRTDAGVHARGQVAAVQLEKVWQPQELERALNGNLPEEIVVQKADRVSDGFDPRRHALWRKYSYTIIREPDPLLARYAWLYKDRLDLGIMQVVARNFVGEHDFHSYSAAGDEPEKNTVRNLMEFTIKRWRKGFKVNLKANSFLTHQVRFLVAMLVAVGGGKMTGEKALLILEQKKRGLFQGMAPAKGLCLDAVGYPGKRELTTLATQPRQR